MRKERTDRLVINAKGDEMRVYPTGRISFDDKKAPIVDEERMIRHLSESRKIYENMEVGQREARVRLNPQYPNLPVFVWLHTDSHLGSIHTDYDAWMRDYNLLKQTPNFYMLSNGDEVDNFMLTAGKAATGMYENPLSPQQQGLMFQRLFKKLDDQGKIISFSFGNHNQWLRGAGYKFENTWLRDFKCPVLNCGGQIDLTLGRQTYKIAISHMHWGTSKLNPTNACKRMLEHEHPDADVVFLGHTHQKEALHFNRGGKDRIGVIGGTYKVNDEFGSEHGMGYSRGNEGGITLALWPDKRRMQVFYSVAEAVEAFGDRRK
jgi:hypothetical protein